MMTMTIRNITAAYFLAAARFVSGEETRYYLKGVFVQRSKGGGLLYTATDGHRMLHIHDPAAEMDGPARIIGIAKPKFPAAWAKAGKLAWENGVLSDEDKTLLLPAAEIDGTFPDYTRIIPRETSGDVAHFNFNYLADFRDVGERFLGTAFVHHNGDNPALVTFHDAPAIGVIMPIRADTAYSDRPNLPAADE